MLNVLYFYVIVKLVIFMAIYCDEKIEFFDRRTRNSSFIMSEPHFHSKHELYYLEKGRTRYFIGNEIYLLEQGDIIFVPKGAFHKTIKEDLRETERLLLVFDDDFINEDYKKYISELKENNHIRIPSDRQYKFKDIFNKIESESKQKCPDYTQLQKLYLEELLILISRHRIKKMPTRLDETYSTIQDAAKYISENYNTDLSLEFLAQKYAMSPSHFSKLFKTLTGIGLNQYINICRISAAEKLLLSGSTRITAVATECGFNDSNYFAAVFKKLKGITPKKYSMLNN